MCVKQDKLTMPLFIMLAQQRRFIATSTDSPHLKLIAELYDKCQETLYLVRRHSLVPEIKQCTCILMHFPYIYTPLTCRTASSQSRASMTLFTYHIDM